MKWSQQFQKKNGPNHVTKNISKLGLSILYWIPFQNKLKAFKF